MNFVFFTDKVNESKYHVWRRFKSNIGYSIHHLFNFMVILLFCTVGDWYTDSWLSIDSMWFSQVQWLLSGTTLVFFWPSPTNLSYFLYPGIASCPQAYNLPYPDIESVISPGYPGKMELEIIIAKIKNTLGSLSKSSSLAHFTWQHWKTGFYLLEAWVHIDTSNSVLILWFLIKTVQF